VSVDKVGQKFSARELQSGLIQQTCCPQIPSVDKNPRILFQFRSGTAGGTFSQLSSTGR